MPDSNLFDQGLIFFNAGKFYEAHEVWEDLWRMTDGPARTFYQGLIQAAVGLHHLKRGNAIGARSQIGKSIHHLSNKANDPRTIDTDALLEQLQEIHERMQPRTVRIVRLK
jgi:hypothetical protein